MISNHIPSRRSYQKRIQSSNENCSTLLYGIRSVNSIRLAHVAAYEFTKGDNMTLLALI